MPGLTSDTWPPAEVGKKIRERGGTIKPLIKGLNLTNGCTKLLTIGPDRKSTQPQMSDMHEHTVL